MILTLLRYPKLNKLNSPLYQAQTKLATGEQYLVQTVDKKLALTNQRLIFRRLPWTNIGLSSIQLEDIVSWKVKKTTNSLYFGLSIGMALLIYFNDSFALLSGFFLMLYFMTRQNRIHINTRNGVTVLPLEVEESRISNLIEMVRKAKHNRVEQLKHQTAMA